jgi:hypothetical protein
MEMIDCRIAGTEDSAFHPTTVVLEFRHEKNAVQVGECVDVDGVSDLCRERFEREYLSLRKRLGCDSFGSGFRLLDKVIRMKLATNGVRPRAAPFSRHSPRSNQRIHQCRFHLKSWLQSTKPAPSSASDKILWQEKQGPCLKHEKARDCLEKMREWLDGEF